MVEKLVTKHPLDKDRLSMVPRDKAANAAFLALHQLQSLDPEEMVLGAGVLFATLAMRCGLDPEQLHTMSRKVIFAPDEGDHITGGSLQVLRDFAGARILGKEVTIS